MFRKIKSYHCILISVLLILNFACQKPDATGLNVIPKSNFRNGIFTDTISLTAITVKDTISSYGNNSSLLMLGSWSDIAPYGKTSCSFITNISFSAYPGTVFSNSSIIDSAILYLAYTSSYGIAPVLFNFSVYKMSDTTNIRDKYYSNYPFKYYPSVVTSTAITPDLITNQTVGTSSYPAGVKMMIDTGWIRTNLFSLNSTQVSTYSEFHKAFPGLYVTSNNSTYNYLLYFNPSSAYSGLTVYYHTGSNATNNLVSNNTYYTLNNSVNAHVNLFKHNATPSSSPADTFTYIQSLGGVKTLVNFKNWTSLINLKGKTNISINQAELIVKPDVSDTAHIPRTLTLAYDLINYQSVDAAYDTINQVYKFNLTSHLQQVIDNIVSINKNDVIYREKTTNSIVHHQGFYIFDKYCNQNISRARIISPLGKGNKKMKLNLIYTKL